MTDTTKSVIFKSIRYKITIKLFGSSLKQIDENK